MIDNSNAAGLDAGPGAAGHPDCPACERRMIMRSVMPVLLADDHDEILYACEACSVEVTCVVKRSRSASLIRA